MMRAIAFLIPLVLTSQAFAQFGGGGFSGGGFGGGGFGPGGIQAKSAIESADIFLVLSNSGKSVTAFSSQTGTMDRFTFDKPIEGFLPIVGNSVACFVTDKIACAFCAKTGRWIAIEIEKKPVPVMSNGFVKFQIDSKIYICSAASKHWQVIDLDKDG